MPSKIATDTPFSWRKLLGVWFFTIVIAYALGWNHITWERVATDTSAPPATHAPTTSPSPRPP